MKRVAWVVWIYALVYNVYESWVVGGGFFTEVGFPDSLRAVLFYALMAGPLVTLIAMLWSLSWRWQATRSTVIIDNAPVDDGSANQAEHR